MRNAVKSFIPICIFLFSILFVKAQNPKNIHLLSATNTGQTMAGCWHYNHSSGREYALLGAANGIMIYDITDPISPAFVTQLPGASSLWHEVKVQGDFAYAVSEGTDSAGIKNGLQIIDLRYLPDSVPNKFFQGGPGFTVPLIRAHSVTTAGHYVYVNGHNIDSLNRGILIFDITDPWFPTFVNAITDNYCHDSYVRGNLLFSSEIGVGQFVEFDITDPHNPILIATQSTFNNFNHNAWLSDNGNVLFTTDERVNSPLASYDISNPGNITLLDTLTNKYFPSKEVHNVRVLNDFLLCPSYGSQLTIVDGARPANMIEIGNYTTGNSLCWDADPYTASGNVIATDMNGLTFYVFQPSYIRACYLEGVVTDSITGQLLFGVDIVLDTTGVQTNSNLSGEYKTGYADSGTYTVTYSKSGYNSKSIVVSLANNVLTNLNVQLVPNPSTVGQTPTENWMTFPNPANDHLIIQFGSENFSYQLMNSTGQIILAGKSFSKEKEIETKNLSSGTYSLQIIAGDRSFKRKVIVDHTK